MHTKEEQVIKLEAIESILKELHIRSLQKQRYLTNHKIESVLQLVNELKNELQQK